MKKLLLLLALVLSCGLASFAETVTDILTASIFGVTGTGQYNDYSWTSKETGVKYAGQFAQDENNALQLRSKKSNSGIVITENTNGYKIVSIKCTVSRGSNTWNVYADETAYTSAIQLYAANGNKIKGTSIGSNNASATIEFTGENADKFEFAGIRSKSGALYLTSVEITYETGAGPAPVAPAAPVVTMGEKTVTVTVEEGCTAYYKFVVVNDQPAIETFALEADTWYPVENNTIDLTKLPMTSGNEKLQLTVKAVNADNVESEVYTTEPFANPGGTTGIADIELGEEAPAEYYNLQGVRMEGELTPGLYIRRQGNKATKVIVK